MKHKYERMIQKNLDLKIPIKLRSIRKKQYHFIYILPFALFFIALIPFILPSNPSIPFQSNDTIVWNQSLNSFATALDHSEIVVLEKQDYDYTFHVPFGKLHFDWNTCAGNTNIYTYETKNFRLIMSSNPLPKDPTLQPSMIEDIPVLLSEEYYGPYEAYTAYFSYQGNHYIARLENQDKEILIHWLKKVLGGN